MGETVRCDVCGQYYTPESAMAYHARICPKCHAKKKPSPIQGAFGEARDPGPPAGDTGQPDPTLVKAVVMMERGVDAVYMNAMSISRLLELGPEDIPRLCIMAGCRMVERMIESYRAAREHAQLRATDHDEATFTETSANDRELDRRQAEIGKALELLVHTLADGLTTAQAIQKSIGVTVDVQ